MTDAETIAANDLLRTELKGGIVLFSPAVWELPAEIRGRMLYRLSLYKTFDDDSLHDRGVFVFAGYSVFWEISEFAGQRSISLLLKDDLLI